MVSSVVGLSAKQLRETLADFKVRYADDPEYQEVRSPFPAEWPI